MIEKPVTFNSITINSRPSPFVLTTYFVSVRSIDGLFSEDRSYESHPIPGKIGERSGDVFKRGKTITLTGRVEAINLPYLRQGMRVVQQMFWTDAASQLRFQFAGEDQCYYTCRVQQPVSMTEAIERIDWVYRDWTVGLRADDPRSYRVSDGALYPSWQT